MALVHELAEPLTAIGNFLDAASRLEQRHTPSAQAKLDEALKKSRAQVARANEVLRRMRDLLRRK